MELIEQLIARAKNNKQRIVLPEGTEERTLKAANQVLTDGVADLILLGNPEEIRSLAKEWGLGNIEKATIIDPENHPKKEEYAQLLCELRKKKGMTIEEARKLVVDPLYLGCLIIKAGDADGQLAGARNTTGNVLRPALQIIKTAPGITCVSGAMLLLTHAPECGDNGVLVMGDVAVTPVPDANQLAQIAVCTAGTAACVAGLLKLLLLPNKWLPICRLTANCKLMQLWFPLWVHLRHLEAKWLVVQTCLLCRVSKLETSVTSWFSALAMQRLSAQFFRALLVL